MATTETETAKPMEQPETAKTSEPAKDTELFGKTPNFERPPENFAGGGNGPEPSPLPGDNANYTEYMPPGGNPEPPKPEPDLNSHRPFAMMIWDSIINFLAVFIHPCWLPRKIGQNVQQGEVPYDERDSVIAAFCEYLQSIGMILLSPGQKLSLAIANYSLPRLMITISVLKTKFGKVRKKPENPANDNRFAGTTAKDITPEPPPQAEPSTQPA